VNAQFPIRRGASSSQRRRNQAQASDQILLCRKSEACFAGNACLPRDWLRVRSKPLAVTFTQRIRRKAIPHLHSQPFAPCVP